MKRILLTLLVAGALAVGLTACGKGANEAEEAGSESYTATRAAMLAGPNVKCYNPSQAKDPVTGETISAQYYLSYEGKRVYFSSKESAQKFESNPEKYLEKLKKK